MEAAEELKDGNHLEIWF